MSKSRSEMPGQLSIEEQFTAPNDEARERAVEPISPNLNDNRAIDDTERGGLSERDRLGVVINENNHIVREPLITNVDAYAQKIAGQGGLKALDNAAQQLRNKGEHDLATELKNTPIYNSLRKAELDR